MDLLRKLRPNIALAVLGISVLGALGFFHEGEAATAAAVTGLVAIAKDIINHDNKLADAENGIKIPSGGS